MPMLLSIIMMMVLMFGIPTGIRLSYVHHKRTALKQLTGVDPLRFKLFGLQSWSWRDYIRLWLPGSLRPEAYAQQAMYQGLSEMARVAEEVEQEKRQWFDSFDIDRPTQWFGQPIPLERWDSHGALQELDKADKLLQWWGYQPLPLGEYAMYRRPSDALDLSTMRDVGGGPMPIEALRIIKQLYVGQVIRIIYSIGNGRVTDRGGNKNGNREFCQGEPCILRNGTVTITAIDRKNLTVDFYYKPERGLRPVNYLCGEGNFQRDLRGFAACLLYDREDGPEKRRLAG